MKKALKKFLMWCFDIKEVPKKQSIEIIDLIPNPSKEELEERELINTGRRSGRTTRHADNIIQRFFKSKTNEEIRYFDHYFIGKLSTCHLRRIIEKRLESEHGLKSGKDFRSGFDRKSNILIKKF